MRNRTEALKYCREEAKELSEVHLPYWEEKLYTDQSDAGKEKAVKALADGLQRLGRVTQCQRLIKKYHPKEEIDFDGYIKACKIPTDDGIEVIAGLYGYLNWKRSNSNLVEQR